MADGEEAEVETVKEESYVSQSDLRSAIPCLTPLCRLNRVVVFLRIRFPCHVSDLCLSLARFSKYLAELGPQILGGQKSELEDALSTSDAGAVLQR